MIDASAKLLCWAVVGNLSEELRAGKAVGELYRGTPVFAPGSKLYLGEYYSGMAEKAHFVGRNRMSRKLSNAVVPLYLMNNLRAVGVYSPSLHKRLQRLGARIFVEKNKAVTEAEFYASVARLRKCERGAARRRSDSSLNQTKVHFLFDQFPK